MLTLADLIRRTRARIDDSVPPYRWSNQELTDYVNDTVRDAAIRAKLTVECNISLPFTQNADGTWNAEYVLTGNILDVRHVWLDSRPSRPLKRLSFRRENERYHYRPVVTQGTPYAFALDRTRDGQAGDTTPMRSITFIGTPTAADTAYLDIERLPAILESDTDVPEIDEIYHPDLVYGISGLAYLKRDTDTFDPNRSLRDLQIFEQRFGERLPAVVMRERQTEVPFQMYLA